MRIMLSCPAMYCNVSGSFFLEDKCLLFGDQENRRAARRNRRGIGERLLTAVRSGARLQSFHAREMDLGNAMEGWRPLRRANYFARHNFGFTAKLLDGHRDMLARINFFEGVDVLWARVYYD